MSWTDEEIDELFKASAERQSFTYKDAYWKEMEALLPEKRKGRDFLWFLTAFLFFGTLSSTFFMHTSRNGSTLMRDNVALAVASSASSTKEENPSSVSAFAMSEATPKAAEEVQDVRVFDIARSRTAETSATSNGRNEGSTTPSVLPLASALSTSLLTSSTQVAIERNEISEPSGLEQSQPTETGRVDGLPLLGLSGPATTLEFTTYPNKLYGVPVRTQGYLQVVGGLSESLVMPSSATSSSFGLGAGVRLHKNNWSTTLGVNGMLWKHSDLELSRVSKYYAFGSKLTTHTFNYQKMMVVEGVVSVSRHFGHHALTFGARPSYIVSTTVEYSRTDEASGQKDAREVKNYMDGLVRFGIKPTFGYDYLISDRWTAGINVGVQLTDSFRPGYVTKENNSFPIDGQIYLRRNFRLKK